MKKMNNVILIAGSARNVGKTYLACEIIKRMSQYTQVVGVKVSPHLHENVIGNEIAKTDNFSIYAETNISSKDSSRMLQAGAMRVYYIETKDDYIGEAFENLKLFLPQHYPVIIESAGARNILEPGMLIFVKRKDDIIPNKNKSLLEKADWVLEFDGANYNGGNVNSIGIEDGKIKWE